MLQFRLRCLKLTLGNLWRKALWKKTLSSSPPAFILPHTIKPKAINEWYNYSVSYCLGTCWIFFFNLHNFWRISRWELPGIFIMKYIKRKKKSILSELFLSLSFTLRKIFVDWVPPRNTTFYLLNVAHAAWP